MSTISALVSLLLNVDPRTTDDEVSAGRIRRDGPRAPAPRSALGAGCSVTTPLILALQEPSAQPLLTMDSPSQLIDARIVELGDWRGETLARVRELVKEADPEVVEEWKWKGTPTWEHDGIICTGETYKKVVKMTFAKGASLEDPSGLFNSSLEGNVRRAIDVHEGEQIDEEAFKDLIRAAVALNTS
jgi:hypothetical protein